MSYDIGDKVIVTHQDALGQIIVCTGEVVEALFPERYRVKLTVGGVEAICEEKSLKHLS